MLNNIEYNRWFFEAINQKEAHISGFWGRILYTITTKYQTVELIETPEYGKMLFIDSRLQSAEADEFIYHEALAHPSMCSLEKAEEVCIIGGGEGALLREVIKYKDIKKILMVDIDKEVVEFAKENLYEFHQGAFEDKRLEVIYQDGREYFFSLSKDILFDVIFIDLPEPAKEGSSYMLFTLEFYEIIKNHLKNKGIVVIQSGSTSITALDMFTSIYTTLRKVFEIVAPYQVFIPSFTTPWGFITASSSIDPRRINKKNIKERISSLELRFYDEDIHYAIFTLPKFIKEALQQKGRVITDKTPLLL